MAKFFVDIYNFFKQHKAFYYNLLILCFALMGFFASQLKFEENITKILPFSDSKQKQMRVFESIKDKDRIVFIISNKSGDEYTLEETAEDFVEKLKLNLERENYSNAIDEYFINTTTEMQNEAIDDVYAMLPLLMNDSDYQRIDSLSSPENIRATLEADYYNLIMPSGIFTGPLILRDPLGIGTSKLELLHSLQPDNSNFNIQDGYLLSQDNQHLLFFLTPHYEMGETRLNDKLVTIIEQTINNYESECEIDYFGGVPNSVYNARKIKHDTILTLIIALSVIVLFMLTVFKNKNAFWQLILPIAFGGLFALACLFFIKGSISAIAIGISSIILGVALSYSIHIVAHQNHVFSTKQLIEELVFPMVVGSFTTIFAFLALVLTKSELLQDFGLFAALSLIGTLIFCLIFLPVLLHPSGNKKSNLILHHIEKWVSYPLDSNKYIIAGLFILTIICLLSYNKVGFSGDLNNLYYTPEHLQKGENKLSSIFNYGKGNVYLVSTDTTHKSAIEAYRNCNQALQPLIQNGTIRYASSAEKFIFNEEEKLKAITKWHNFWTEERKENLKQLIQTEGVKLSFNENAFKPFFDYLDTDFNVIPTDFRLAKEYCSGDDIAPMYLTSVYFDENQKETVYKALEKIPNTVIFDRSFYMNEIISSINSDFNLVLFISAFLIFITLLLTYGRIELTLMSFAPMFLSWIIIIGIMGILDIDFNIVTIIISTFIFGIGDDFSIFIMDGLQNKFRTGKELLNAHKIAIFFSAFVLIVGMGVLIFAEHPAMRSISWMSILGMTIVVLVSYSLQPLIFRWIALNPKSKNMLPYTLKDFLSTVGLFMFFVVISILINIILLFVIICPGKRDKKELLISYLIHWGCAFIRKFIVPNRIDLINLTEDTFKQPSIIIANHQSILEVILFLSLHPKLILVTNKSVWNTPLFGAVIRYAGFVPFDDSSFLSQIKKKTEQGYSVVIFPEGTRSLDNKIKSFYPGAFFISERLKLPIAPTLLYGTGNTIHKSQMLYRKNGIIAIKFYQPISNEDKTLGVDFKERTNTMLKYYQDEYQHFSKTYDALNIDFFRQRLIGSFTYKGKSLEKSVKQDVKNSNAYEELNKLIDIEGVTTIINNPLATQAFMLSMRAEKREIYLIENDEEALLTIQNSILFNNNIHLQKDFLFVESDAFIFNDSDSYSDVERFDILKNCLNKLKSEGKILIYQRYNFIFSDFYKKFAEESNLNQANIKEGKNQIIILSKND